MKRKKRGNGEGTIFEDKKRNRWVAQYICGINEQGKNIRKSIYGKTQKEVLKKLNEAQYKINNNIYIEKNGIELVKVMEDIREEKFESNVISEGQYFRIGWTIKKIKDGNLGKEKYRI